MGGNMASHTCLTVLAALAAMPEIRQAYLGV
jgi:hypothetical protein